MEFRVQNFQRHVDTTLVLKPGLTSIIGRSDHGKTSLWRALYWFKFDRPLGLSFMRKGQSQTIVSVDNIDHVRTKVKNYYLKDGVPIDPKEAQNSINIDLINLQEQQEPPFLLKDSPGEVARKLALLIDLTKPQNLLRDLKSKGSKLEAQRKGLISLKNNLEEKIKQYALVEQYQNELAVITSRFASIEKQWQSLTTLGIAIENATQAKLRLDTMPNTKALETQATALRDRAQLMATEYRKAEILRNTIILVEDKKSDRIPDISYLSTKGEKVLTDISSIIAIINMSDRVGTLLKKLRAYTICKSKAESVVGMLTPVEEMIITISRVVRVNELLMGLRSLRNSINALVEEEKSKEATLAEVRTSIDICPFCGR